MQTQKLFGNFNGTGAAVYLCVGPIPVSVKLIDVENSTNSNFVEWNRSMLGSASAYGGILMTGSTGVYTKITTAGIFPYEGGDLMTAANQTTTAYGEGVFLGWDTKDYRADPLYGPIGGATLPINKWTFNSALTGAFNVDLVASGSRIGVGSIIRIREYSSGLVKEAGITTVTSTATSTTGYVALTRAIGTGDITYIGGTYRLAPLAIGKKAPAGVYVADTTVNVNDDTVTFEMETEVA